MRGVCSLLNDKANLAAKAALLCLSISVAGCGFFGGGVDVPTDTTPQVAGAVATPTVLQLTNENWDLAVQDADRYRGSPVDITGQVFYVIGDYDGASHYQLFTDPAARTGNTHLAVLPDGEKLSEGDNVHVIGTLERMLVASSRGGGELRLPYVTASSVAVLSGNRRSASATPAPAIVTPVTSPSPSPRAETPTPAPPTATPPSPTATASPPPLTATATVSLPTATATPLPATATTAPPSPTTTPVPPTVTPSPTVTVPASLAVPATVLSPSGSMRLTADPTAPGGSYLSASKSSREWSGAGPVPADAGAASFSIDVPEGGRYALWVRTQYQNVDGNSLWLVVDNQRAILLGNEDRGYGVWKWVGWRDGNAASRINVDLATGVHTITLVGREAGTRFDEVLITQDLNYRPPDPPAPSPTAAPASANTAPSSPTSAAPPPAAATAATGPPSPVPSPSPPPPTATRAPAPPSPTATPVPSNAPVRTTATATVPPPTPSPTPPAPTATATTTRAAPTPAASPTQPVAAGSYTVQPGDSLWSIAQRVYGDGGQFQRIYDANRDKLSSPDLVSPGTQLRIPR